MTVGQFLNETTKKLSDAGIATAKLDCLILLEDVLELNRATILAHPEAEIPPKTEVRLNTKIAQRITHKPLAYIRGEAEFYGRTFVVNEHTLVPRPESEDIINLLKQCNIPKNPVILDVGTGSGCLGITAALEIPASKVLLSDVDKKALEVAKKNSEALQVGTAIVKSDLLTNITERLDIILANLPYIPDGYPVNQAAQYEPKLALYAGNDGLYLYRQLWKQVNSLPNPPKYVIVESLQSQHQALKELAEGTGYSVFTSAGLVQCFQATQSAQRLA